MNGTHPVENRQEWQVGQVLEVNAAGWTVDVVLVYTTGAILREVPVLSHFLPEVHTPSRQSKVLVGWLDAYQQAPVAIPIHHVIIPEDVDKSQYVFWSEHLGFRTTIDRSGNLEIRNLKNGRLLQIQMQELGGIVRLQTPKTQVELHDDDGKITIAASNTVHVTCQTARVDAKDSVNLICPTARVVAPDVRLGLAPNEPVVLGYQLLLFLQQLVLTFNIHTHPDVEPNDTPALPPLETMLSQVTKTE